VSPTNYQLTQKIYNIGMKHIKYRIIPLLLLISFLPLSKVNATSLDAEIAKIKSAPPHLRVKLMNQLKMKIWKMRQAQRIRAIKRLRRSIPTSKRVVIHTIKHNRDKKRDAYTLDDHIATNNSLKHRVDIINHHNIMKMAHDLVETHKDIINRHNTQIDNHIDKINNHNNIIISKIPTATTDNHTSQNQKNPTTINNNTSKTKEIQNSPLPILDTKPSNDSSNMVVKIEEQQPTNTDIDKQNININNTTKTELSNKTTMINNQKEQTINITQSSNTNIDNKTIKVDNSIQADTKVINIESTSTIHQDNQVEPKQNNNIEKQKVNNIETHRDIHIEEQRDNIKIHEDIHIKENNNNIPNSKTSTSQNYQNMRSLIRINILNRSRRR